MKICLISMTNLFLCPYIEKYSRIIADNQLADEIDLIYWNRHNIEENTKQFNKSFAFEKKLHEHEAKTKKLIAFLDFAKYCKTVIKKQKYDRIIFLHNNLPLLMPFFLKTKYTGNYLVDIRDYTMEKNRLFYFLEKSVIHSAGMAVISSPGYKEFLPKANYYICHNDCRLKENDISSIHSRESDRLPIRISFIGLVRFYKQNKKLLDIFGNDERFILAFYGQNSESLKQYAVEKGYTNVDFVGRFSPEQVMEFYKRTDVINNFYGNNSIVLKYALSNKLYYAATLGLPILVCKETYMYDASMKYGFGITIDETSEKVADQFYDTFMQLDKHKIIDGGEAFMKEVQKDNDAFEKGLEVFLT